jgi:signal transduction histidine kinase
MSERQAMLEDSHAAIEDTVSSRTSELRAANASLADNQGALRKAYDELRQATKEREALHGRLVSASRQAGMAEVATGVLHNVGNVLNSVNVAAQLMSGRLRESEVDSLAKVCNLIRENEAQLSTFLVADERGRHIPRFIMEVSECLSRERKELEQELRSIVLGVEHVKHVVNLQQEHAKSPSIVDIVRPSELVSAALGFVQESLTRHGVEVVCRVEVEEPLTLDKHQVIQILVNLITNARQAVAQSQTKRICVTVERSVDDSIGAMVRFIVTDSGGGIAAEHLTRIFQHGFTTKADGHGFGLHSAAVSAQAMKGSIKAHSRGVGHGASFTLTLPEVTARATAPNGEY